MKNPTKKLITALLFMTMALNSALVPLRVSAWGAATGIDPVNAAKEYGLDTIAVMMAKSFLGQVTKEAVKWIQGGFQGNPFVPENYVKWAENAGDRAGGLFLDQLTDGTFSDLCDFQGWNVGLNLPRAKPFEIETKCTLSEFNNNFYSKFSDGGWESWLQVSQPQNNPYGLILLSVEEKNRRESEAQTSEERDLSLNQGFLSQREEVPPSDAEVAACTSQCANKFKNSGPQGELYLSVCTKTCSEPTYKITTPGEVISGHLEESLGSGVRSLELADELNEVIGALVNYAVSRMIQGVVQHGSGSSSSQSPVGGSSYQSLPSLLTTSYTIDMLKRDIKDMKYSLYDYRIIRFDIKFKPSNNPNDPNYDPIAYRDYQAVYAKTYRDGSPLNINNANDYGVLAGASYFDDLTGSYKYRGFDLIARSPKVANSDQPELFFRKIGKERVTKMLLEAMEVRIAKASGEANDYNCRLMDESDNNYSDTTIDHAKDQLKLYDLDIMEIEDYFGPQGSYTYLLRSIQTLESAITALDLKLADDAPSDTELKEVESLAESLITLKNRLPDKFTALTKRADDMVNYGGSNPCTNETNCAVTSVNKNSCLNTKYPNDPYKRLSCDSYDGPDYLESKGADGLARGLQGARTEEELNSYYGNNNMHCWVITEQKYDEYGTWSAASDGTLDTCNGDTSSPYVCAASDSISGCIDVSSNVQATATGGSGGSANGGGGSGGSASVSTSLSQRTVTCTQGGGPNPSSGGTNTANAPDAPYQSIGFNFGMCSSDPRITESVHDGYYWSQRECMASFVGHSAAVIKCQLALGADHATDPGYGCGYTSTGQVTACLTALYSNPGMARCPGGTPY